MLKLETVTFMNQEYAISYLTNPQISANPAIYSGAMPNEAADGETANPSPAHATNSRGAPISGDFEEEEVSPEEAELDKKLTELKEKLCLQLLGDCWILYDETKPYLDEEHRLKVCLKRIQGFAICEFANEAQAQQAKEEGEQRQRAEQEEEADKQLRAAERKEKLAKRKEELVNRRLTMKEEAEAERQLKTSKAVSGTTLRAETSGNTETPSEAPDEEFETVNNDA